jgi:hypothetical protein
MAIQLKRSTLESLAVAMEVLGQASGHEAETRLGDLKVFVTLALTPADRKWLSEDRDVLDYFGIYLEEPDDKAPEGFTITDMIAEMPLPWDTAALLARSRDYYRVGGEDTITLKANTGKTASYRASSFGINDRQFKVLSIHLGDDMEDGSDLLA